MTVDGEFRRRKTQNFEQEKMCVQCDQISRFFGLWANFQSHWQQLICPNLPHS